MKILFVDVDGTLTDTKSGEPFKQDAQDIKVIPSVEEALTYYQEDGYTIIGISNQGGVGAGYKENQQAIEEMQNTITLLPQIERIFFCPDSYGVQLYCVTPKKYTKIVVPKHISSCRKPGCGMVEYALEDLPENFICGVDTALMVGDRVEDMECAGNAKIEFMWASQWRNLFLR